jgi:polysaccharide export outer membrane protein
MRQALLRQEPSRALALLLAIPLVLGPLGCRNPAQSSLPPSAVAPPGEPLPPLPKGDLYADETTVSPDAPIEPGDTLEVVIRRGAGEEKYTALVRETGVATVSFVEIEVGGLTAAQAEARIQELVAPYMRNPRVQVQLKKRVAKLKRIFVFGDVKKPGMYPMARHMTVLQAVASADNYNETALLEEIRVIRGNLQRPEILTADLARLLTYGDWTRNLPLEENDIVFVPREKLGDVTKAAEQLLPIIWVTIMPLWGAAILPAVVPGLVHR